MFSFDKLSRDAQRAAFAKMSAGRKGNAARKVAQAATTGRAAQLKAEQDARIRAATKQRVAADKAETQRHIAIWAGRPSR